MDSGLVVQVRDRVGYVTIDRRERMNALSDAMMAALVDTFQELDQDDGVWAVLVTGAGDDAFSAGRDLKELAERDREDKQRHPAPMRQSLRNPFEVVYECRKPVVAALNGWTLGGGLELALACDVRIAAAHARLAMPEVRRGMGANFGAAILPRLVPQGVAYDLLYTGRTINAEEAQRWGLVNSVVPSEQLSRSAEKFVRGLLESAPLTIRHYKAVLQGTPHLPLAAALRLDLEPNPYESDDRVEGVCAFAEKRKPQWRAR